MASTSQHRTNTKKVVKVEKMPDPIIISSDDEEEVTLPSAHRHNGRCRINFNWDWKKEVTRAVADLNRKQTLHIPSRVVKQYMRHSEVIMVQAEETMIGYCCSVLAPPERGANVRYLADGWYEYLEDHRPEVGDVLLFDVGSTRNTIIVKLVRAKDRRIRR